MNRPTFTRSSLTTAAAGALLLGASAVSAATLSIRPDGGTAATNLYGPDSALQNFNVIEQYVGTSASAEADGKGTLTWPLRITLGGDGLNNGDTFTESFVMSWDTYCVLGTATQCGGMGSSGFQDVGLTNATNVYRSHVSTLFTLSGTIQNVSLGADDTTLLDDEWSLKYDSAQLDFIFDSDGDTDPTVGNGTLFATFTGTGASTVFATGGLNANRADLNWSTTWQSGLGGYLQVDGVDVTTLIDPLVLQIAQQDVIRSGCDNINQANDMMVMCLLTSDGPSTGSAVLSVPEPATLGLLGVALFGLGATARRGRKSQA